MGGHETGSALGSAQRFEYEFIGVKPKTARTTDWPRVYEALDAYAKAGWRLMSIDVRPTGMVLLLWERDYAPQTEIRAKRPLGFLPITSDD